MCKLSDEGGQEIPEELPKLVTMEVTPICCANNQLLPNLLWLSIRTCGCWHDARADAMGHNLTERDATLMGCGGQLVPAMMAPNGASNANGTIQSAQMEPAMQFPAMPRQCSVFSGTIYIYQDITASFSSDKFGFQYSSPIPIAIAIQVAEAQLLKLELVLVCGH